jgi:hypothetical protein
MRRTAFTLMFMVLSTTVFAQEETLFTGTVTNGGYGGPGVKLTTVNGTTGVFVGGKGSWIINHSFGLGGAAFGLATPTDVPEIAQKTFTRSDGSERDLEMGIGYGGIVLEYFFTPNKLIHMTADMMVGGGAVVYAENWEDEDDTWDVNDAFLVLEPGIDAELNVTPWFRINAGVSYLLARDIDIVGMDDSDLGGVAGNILFKFGTF